MAIKLQIVFAGLFVVSLAAPEESTKTKRGLLELEHAPALLPAPILTKSYSTPIIQSAPVITKVFDAPPLPIWKGIEPSLITGPLITKGWGPQILGAKTLLPAPIIKTAPLYTTSIISKPIWAPAPIISYAPKLAPISLGHGW